MKKFLQSPWGAAMVTAVFFLIIMGGVAVMAKKMIDSRFAESNKAHEPEAHSDGPGTEPAEVTAKTTEPNTPPVTAKTTELTAPPVTAKTTELTAPPVTAKTTELTAPPVTVNITELNTPAVTANTTEPNMPPVTANTTEPNMPPVTAKTTEPNTPPVTAKTTGLQITTTEDPPAQPNQPVDSLASNTMDPHWTYDGKTGPSEWYKMKSDWAIAEAGIRQSPINIIPERTMTLPTLKPIEFHYSGGLHLLKDNGHTIQVDIKNDKNYIVINDNKYKLLQFHFHAKSEHEINSHAAKMEVHLVHKLVTDDTHDDSCDPLQPASGDRSDKPEKLKVPQDQLAVIGVMIESGPEAHSFIKDLWSDLGAVKPNDGGIRFRLDGPISLLPPKGKRSYYRYNGSLTTPPCSENVLWTVMAEPIHFSAAQIKAFTDRYSSNARPVKEKNRRFVLKYEDQPVDIIPVVIVPFSKAPTSPTPGTLQLPGTGVPHNPNSLLPRIPAEPQTNAPSIGVRGGIGLGLPGLPGLPSPGTVPAPQPR